MAPRYPHPEHHVDLLGGPAGNDQALRRAVRPFPYKGPTSETSVEASLDLAREHLVIYVTGRRHHEVARPVVQVEEATDLVDLERRDALGCAEHLTPEGMLGEHRSGALLGCEICSLVGVHQDLVEYDLAFGLDVFTAQRRIGHDRAEDVESEAQVLGEQPYVEGRVLLRGEGVHVAAHLVDRLGDLGRAPGRCALEEKVLHEVRRSGALVVLVARAGADPNPERHRPRVHHRLCDQSSAAVERLYLDHNDGVRRTAAARQ